MAAEGEDRRVTVGGGRRVRRDGGDRAAEDAQLDDRQVGGRTGQAQRGRVGGVQVLEDDDEQLVHGGRAQRAANGVEQVEAVLAGGRWAGVVPGRVLGQAGDQPQPAAPGGGRAQGSVEL